MTEANDTRQRILEAASERLLHYGYSKTTMSEIAKDCDMSAGNIYRFFASKLDIAEALAHSFHAELLGQFAQIATRDHSPADRLRGMFEHHLKRTFGRVEDKAKILEIAEVLQHERPKYFNSRLANERKHIIIILQDGIDDGLFRDFDDLDEIAEFIQYALMKFRLPQQWSALSLEELQRELHGVMDLLLAGLSVDAKVPARNPESML